MVKNKRHDLLVRKSMLVNTVTKEEKKNDDIEDYTEAWSESRSTALDGYNSFPKKEKTNETVAKKRKHISSTEFQIKKPQKNQRLYKQPTVEEINHLNETENLFHSNLFRLQIDEMLKETKGKQKYIKFIDIWLEQFSNFLEGLKSSKEKEQSDNMSWFKKSKMKSPLKVDNIISKNFLFQFLKPIHKPFVIGSAYTHTLIGLRLTVDICVIIPKKVFQKDDYLNIIYDQKRAFYLTYLAWQLTKNNFDLDARIKFRLYRNNPLKPVLEVTPSQGIGRKLTFRIFVSPEENSFKLNRFVPWNSNVRGSAFKDECADTNSDLPLATPNYNASILFDLAMAQNNKFIQEVISARKNLQEGLMLLKIWLRRRYLDEGYSGFGSYLMTMLVVYLFKKRKLQLSMSSYQIARCVWNYLAISVWNQEGGGITLCDDFGAANQPSLEQFHVYYDLVFIDSSGFLNLAANLSVDVYFRVKQESTRAVQLLNQTKLNSFEALFMVQCPVYCQFDHIIELSKESLIDRLLKTKIQRADKYSYAGSWYPQLYRLISGILRKGLGGRISAMAPIETLVDDWDVTESPKHLQKSLRIGLILNPENAFEVFEKGPQGNEEASVAFREFWGDKSELRRFQDGSITETCLWCSPTESMSQKRLIPRKIVEHLLAYHFGINSDDITDAASDFDVAFKLNKVFSDVGIKIRDAEQASLAVVNTFDEIGKHLRSLDTLPLDITGFHGISSVFRYCDPEPILPDAKFEKDVFYTYKVNDGIIQLGASGKWPSELTALRCLKAAFYIQIAQLLRTKFHLPTKATTNDVTVLKNGFAFRIQIAHQKEIGLLKKSMSEKGIVQYRDTPNSLELEKRISIIPRVTSALHGLYQKCPAFGPTVMIAKRWLYCQLIDNFLWPDECTELLIASQFIKGNALSNPCQPQIGFLRFLHLLANTDWNAEIVLLNFNEEMPDEEILELQNRFISERESFPKLFIATSYDSKKYGAWTQSAPSVQILARVTLLAKHALSILEPTFFDNTKHLVVDNIFVPSFEGYDVIIHLNAQKIARTPAHEFNSTFNKYSGESKEDIVLADLHPVKIGLQKLRNAFTDFCVFFYNPCGGTEIAVIWKPNIYTVKEFKVTDLNGCQVVGDDEIQCNLDVLITDFKIILKDLCTYIENKQK